MPGGEWGKIRRFSTFAREAMVRRHPLIRSGVGLFRRFRLLFSPLHGGGRYYRNYSNILAMDPGRLGIYAALKRSLPKGGTVLDVGCGTGYVTNFLGADGVDVSDEALAVARARFPGLKCTKVALGTLLKGRRRWDALVCVNVLEHLNADELLDFLERAGNLLKPGGTIHVVYDNMYHPLQLLSGLLHPGMLLTDPTHVHCWTRSQFRRLLGDFFDIQSEKAANILSRGLPWTNLFGTASLFVLKPKQVARVR